MSDEGKRESVSDAAEEQVLAELDDLLAELPMESPPEALVARTLRAVAQDQGGQTAPEESAERRPPSRGPGLPWRLLAAVLLVAFLLVSAVVQYRGTIKALFEAADAEVDTVDTDL